MKPFYTLMEVGDKVKCLYGDAGHKFWVNTLDPFVTIIKIKKHKHKPWELQFKESKKEWFYSNDFTFFEEKIYLSKYI